MMAIGISICLGLWLRVGFNGLIGGNPKACKRKSYEKRSSKEVLVARLLPHVANPLGAFMALFLAAAGCLYLVCRPDAPLLTQVENPRTAGGSTKQPYTFTGTLRRVPHTNYFELLIKNNSSKTVMTTVYRWQYRLDLLDRRGQVVSEEDEHLEIANVAGPLDTDFVRVPPGGTVTMKLYALLRRGVVKDFKGVVTAVCRIRRGAEYDSPEFAKYLPKPFELMGGEARCEL
jgi:hypothetical protein